jgi:selenobiotic family peptide radical SAM maturase
MNLTPHRLEEIYPACRSLIDTETWNQIISVYSEEKGLEELIMKLENRKGELGLPGFLPELARLERIVRNLKTENPGITTEVIRISVNPSLQLLPLSWKNLVPFVNFSREDIIEEPKPAEEMILVCKNPETGEIKIQPASREDLLALKIVVDEIDPREAARIGNVPISSINALISRAVNAGILIAPAPKIRREEDFPRGRGIDERFLTAGTFTLQWHITQACDLRCRHCYDRSERSHLPLERAIAILDELYDFCSARFVHGQVSFSGGNPFLYPYFEELYKAASDRGFSLAILGNPVKREWTEKIVEIERPVFFQVSLEGLKGHNDVIRGPGHFGRTIEFLDLLRDLGIYSMVMLTVTEDNLDQVIPLAEFLRGKTDLFNFNRLSMVGEGANLRLPSQKEYTAFLKRYNEAAKGNPVMGLKDNLINILRYRDGLEPFGGCTGHGCGAAFNFVTLLPDGEVHACRKLPSKIGNIFESSLAEIYDSEIARCYRRGCRACGACDIRPVCGGCLAIAHSYGLDIFREHDPFCFIDSRPGS